MGVSRYDLFSGYNPADSLWLEVATDLRVACERMNDLAMKAPGPYFVRSAESGEIVARVDTSKPESKRQSAG